MELLSFRNVVHLRQTEFRQRAVVRNLVVNADKRVSRFRGCSLMRKPSHPLTLSVRKFRRHGPCIQTAVGYLTECRSARRRLFRFCGRLCQRFRSRRNLRAGQSCGVSRTQHRTTTGATVLRPRAPQQHSFSWLRRCDDCLSRATFCSKVSPGGVQHPQHQRSVGFHQVDLDLLRLRRWKVRFRGSGFAAAEGAAWAVEVGAAGVEAAGAGFAGACAALVSITNTPRASRLITGIVPPAACNNAESSASTKRLCFWGSRTCPSGGPM